jgi:hypothetical protein
MTNLITGLESITETIKQCIIRENVTGGLLEDVEDIITVYNNENGVETPGVWMVQHPTTPVDRTDLRQQLTLSSPFEFVCIEYDEDPEEAERKSQNLATRVALSVLKNYRTMQSRIGNKPTIRKIEFNTYRPVGEISVQGKSEKVPVTGIILNVIHDVDWMNCCKQLQSQQNNDNENEEEEE